jgi:hypothetical protein
MARDIDDVLDFRTDLPPFLVHLTRSGFRARSPEDFDETLGGQTAADNLREILESCKIRPGRIPPCDPVSPARYGCSTKDMEADDLRRFFHAVCFSETPLGQVHALLDIDGRWVDLQPYGLVFRKERLVAKGVSPVWYVNNVPGDKDPVFRMMAQLTKAKPEVAEQVLPLMSLFGQKIRPWGAGPQEGEVDFRWEREWRLPASQAPLRFDGDDVFVGLCPDDEIVDFESRFSPLKFIDPARDVQVYARKLVQRRKELGLTESVVP